MSEISILATREEYEALSLAVAYAAGALRFMSITPEVFDRFIWAAMGHAPGPRQTAELDQSAAVLHGLLAAQVIGPLAAALERLEGYGA